MKDEASRPRVRSDILFRRVGDEWVLFDPVADQLHAINLAAALVWRLLADGESLDAISSAVAEAFDGKASGDPVAEALHSFREAGLLEDGS